MALLLAGVIVGHSRWAITGDKSKGIYNLHIKNASLSDDGEYQCQVGQSGQRIKAIRTSAHLTVLCEYHNNKYLQMNVSISENVSFKTKRII